MLPRGLATANHPILELERRQRLKLKAVSPISSSDNAIVTGQERVGTKPRDLREELSIGTGDLGRQQLSGANTRRVERPLVANAVVGGKLSCPLDDLSSIGITRLLQLVKCLRRDDEPRRWRHTSHCEQLIQREQVKCETLLTTAC